MTSPRRPKRSLSPEQKYDLWVRMLCGQMSQTDAAAEAGVGPHDDRHFTAAKVARDDIKSRGLGGIHGQSSTASTRSTSTTTERA